MNYEADQSGQYVMPFYPPQDPNKLVEILKGAIAAAERGDIDRVLAYLELARGYAHGNS
jgi:hypothetical protein